MKKSFLYSTLYLILILALNSCSDDLSDLNANTKDPSEVDGEDLFSSAQKKLADILSSPETGENNLRLWVQYWQETTYPDESRYLSIAQGVSDTYWETIYTEVLKDLHEAHKIIDETDDELSNDAKPNKKAIIEILTAYTFANLVETYGDIPYQNALDINNTLPEYTDAKEVYLALIERLDKAIKQFNSEGSFDGEKDLIYQGDVHQWKLFANTLKLRMGIVLADQDPELAQQTVEEAYKNGVFNDNDDDALYHYPGDVPNNNPVNNTLVVSGRKDFVVGQTLVNKMNNLKDPRRAFYFDPNLQNDLGEVENIDHKDIILNNFNDKAEVGHSVYINGEDDPKFAGYIEKITGNSIRINYELEKPQHGDHLVFANYKGGEIGAKSVYNENSHVHQNTTKADFPGTLLSFIESEFLLAEANERGFNVGKSAKEHYDTAIKASFEKWNAPHVARYLSQDKVTYEKAKSASNSNPKWKKVIGTQAWIALYNRTFASWLSVRRLDYPVLTAPKRRNSSFPLRYTYPINEQNLNESNHKKAAERIGGDKVDRPLFWDKNNTQEIWNW